MVIGIFIIGLLFVAIALFAFPRFSPIPYFPSNKKDLPYIVQALRLKNNQTVIDLGAGDGTVIFKAAGKAFEQKLNTRFIATDINPILLFVLHVRRFFHANRKNIRIIYADMFTMDFSRFRIHASSFTLYLYVSPWYLNLVIEHLKLIMKNFRVVSYMYQIPGLSKLERKYDAKIHPIYTYILT